MQSPTPNDAPAVVSATDLCFAHFGLRLLIGVNLLMHGVVRLPKLSGFANGVSKGFEGTLMPPTLALPFAYAIPLVEVVIGALLVVGFLQRWALLAGLGLMVMLTAGSCITESWSAVHSQLLHGFVLAALLAGRRWSHWSVDSAMARRAAG